MIDKAEHHRRDLIDKVVSEIERRLDEAMAPDAARFARRFYERVPIGDLERVDPTHLFGAAVSLWRFAARRPPGTAAVRVLNPTIEEHGWLSEHTVVEVVTDDMPFLVDSTAAALAKLDLAVHLVIHPVVPVRRDGDGHLLETLPPDQGAAAGGAICESVMHFEVTAQSGEARLTEIEAAVIATLTDVRATVEDWKPSVARLDAAIAEIPHASDTVREFLTWLRDNHFTLLGCRSYRIGGTAAKPRAELVEGSGLGILRNPEVSVFHELRHLERMPRHVQSVLLDPAPLVLTKASRRSTVHRPVHMDVVCVKTLDAKGKVAMVHMFAGLYTSAAYSRSSRDIPLLRDKSAAVLARAGLPAGSHDGKALAHIIETFPRDEMIQATEEELYQIAVGILHLQERQKVSLFVRRDAFQRFVSCFVFVPRDRFSTELRRRLQEILERAFEGRAADFYTLIGDLPMARLQVIVAVEPGHIPEVDLDELERELALVARSWSDGLADALTATHGEERGQALVRRYQDAFPSGYCERFAAQSAVGDLDAVERALSSAELGMNLYRPIEAPEDQVRFKIYHRDGAVALSTVLPMLENMGFRVIDEIPYAVRPRTGAGKKDRALVMIHDFGLESGTGAAIDLGALRDNFQQTFIRVWRGEVENDGFNRLVQAANLSWREVVVLRAYSRYLRQTGIAYSQDYMQTVLLRNPEPARLLLSLFEARFDPRDPVENAQDGGAIEAKLLERLDAVRSADDDRILRRFLNLIQSTLRTNHYQRAADGGPKSHLSFKLDSALVEDLPLPRPWREIWVYSPRVEGVHLRGGPVARGGLRWSDRPEDFRTEILGLVKSQVVKNAVIVPVGSKGGFVVKCPPAEGGRPALVQEGIACYKTFICGLLDLTDNLVEGRVQPPPDLTRLDGDDPYLVVAADKGTATFSDIANGVAAQYGFWLGDAFASGGSAGYDHKKMGITARGAWESVKRHFREMGHDTQTRDFTVAGVGDMGGDVFGNAMLLSRHIKLVAAFNHLHIFLDPAPDPARSWTERKRLFDEVKGWDQYDTKLISKGGGVFERSAKVVQVSPETAGLLGIKAGATRPNDLIRAILAAPVDLLFFGGIGTYVKASTESHADVGDRANDGVRLDGRDLRAKVVGEGANLGATQRGRIEFALSGGRLNTDFVDNSGGVDCSDHEVNIKILLTAVEADGDMTRKQRDRLLEEMTDEVAELVLRDNYGQTQALTLAESQGLDQLDHQIRLMRMLERAGRLDRAVEFLPSDEELAERAAARKGLTRPELAVLMSYAKIWLFDELLASNLPDDPQMADDLMQYFPAPLRAPYRDVIARHRLRREIVATKITNSLINRVGGTFVMRMAEETGAEPAEVARAYLITREVFALREVWSRIEALDMAAPAAQQVDMLHEANRLIERGTLWFLRHGRHPLDVGANVSAFGPGVAELTGALDKVLRPVARDGVETRARALTEKGVPEDLANRVAGLLVLVSGCDIVRVADDRGMSVLDVADIYFAVGPRFSLGWMRAQAEQLGADNHWQKLAVTALIEDLYRHQSDLTLAVIDAMGKGTARPKTVEKAIDDWAKTRPGRIARAIDIAEELHQAETTDFAMLAVASRQLRALVD